MIMHLNIDYWLKKPQRIELFNFKKIEFEFFLNLSIFQNHNIITVIGHIK